MDSSLIVASEDLLKKIDKMSKFGSKYKVFPYNEAVKVLEEVKEIAESIIDTPSPINEDQLFESELKRRLNGEALNLEQRLAPRYYDFDIIIDMYGIPRSDIDGLQNWLIENKVETQEAIDRLYHVNDVQSFELPTLFDIPKIRKQSEKLAEDYITKYHHKIGELLQDLTKIGGFLNEVTALPTINERSYFNIKTNILGIAIPKICFTAENGSLQIKESELIGIYGHEGMGHALNQLITNKNGLPYFLTRHSFLVEATMESVAQFYEKVIFDDLKESPETQKELGIQDKFEEIYTGAKDIAQLSEYNSKFFQYAITVLADKTLGDIQDPKTLKKKIDLLNEVAIDPTLPLSFIENNRYSFDSQGNLNSNLIAELRYCAQPVQRALDEFAKNGIYYDGKGRSRIDETLLKGFWTPIGYVDNARLNAIKK